MDIVNVLLQLMVGLLSVLVGYFLGKRSKRRESCNKFLFSFYYVFDELQETVHNTHTAFNSFKWCVFDGKSQQAFIDFKKYRDELYKVYSDYHNSLITSGLTSKDEIFDELIEIDNHFKKTYDFVNDVYNKMKEDIPNKKDLENIADLERKLIINKMMINRDRILKYLYKKVNKLNT